MEYGHITKFDPDRAFGFIAPDVGGSDVFFHVSGLDRGVDPRQLRPGIGVSFDEATGPKGIKAVRVKVLVSREEDRWPEYAAQPPAQPADQATVDSVWEEASKAAYEAFRGVLYARGLL